MSELELYDDSGGTLRSYASHLYQKFTSKNLDVEQGLFFRSPHKAIILTTVINRASSAQRFSPAWKGSVFPGTLCLAAEGKRK